MFLFFEPVKIFDQFIFLLIINRPNVPFREFLRVISHRLIDFFGLYTVQFGDITVEDDLLVAQGDDSDENHKRSKMCIF